MNLEQFVGDLDELVDKLKKQFQKKKVLLVGHSCSTNIGVAYPQAHPDNVSAYMGIGQIANSAEGERRTYAFTLAEAKRRMDAEALAELTKIGAPRYSIDAMMIQRGWLDKYGGASRKQRSMLDLMLT